MSKREGSAGTPTRRWWRSRALPLPPVLLLLLLSAPLLLGARRASSGKSKCPEQQFFPRGGDVKALCDAHYPRGGDRRAGSNWFVMFFAPWCGHCQRLHPTFTELAGAASGWARFGSVDCTQHEAASTCRENSVHGYPALKLVKPDGVVEDYRGPRELPQLMAFLHGHVEAVGNNQLGKKKRERQQRRRREEEEEEQQAASGDGSAAALRQLQGKCKDSAWFYSPKQHHVYNLCDGFFPPAVAAAAAVGSGDGDVGAAAAGQRSMLDGGRGRDIWWVQFYAPYSTTSVGFKKEYKAWAKELHARHTAATAAKGGTDGTGAGGNGSGGEDAALASVAAAVHLGAVNCDDHRDLCTEMLGTVDEVAFPTIKVYGPDGVPRDYARAYDLRALAEFTAQVFLPHTRFRTGHSGGAVAGASDAAAGNGGGGGGGAPRDDADQHASMFAAFAAKLRARGIDMAPAAARRLFDEKMRKTAAAAAGNEKGEL